MSRTNIVYLHSHDTGRHASPHGFAVDTPNLQRLAGRGTTFRQAFCANPTCSPSRACLLSGRYAHANGMLGLVHRGGRLADPARTLPTLLRDAGYETAIAGLQHVVPADRGGSMGDVGYTRDLCPDRVPGGGGTPVDWEAVDRRAADAAVGFLEARRPGDAPFFLDAGFFATHRTPPAGGGGGEPGGGSAGDASWHNGPASPAGDPRFVRVPAPLPDTPAVRADYADFAAAVARLDRLHGRVLDALDAAGLREDTLVVVTTDHGLAFPRMKCNLTHHGTGVLLLVGGPGFGGGRVVDSLVSHVDLLPTLCEAAGVDTPAWAQGRSMRSALAAPADPAAVRDAVYAEVNHHVGFEPMRSVRTATHSYVRRLGAAATASPAADARPPRVWEHIDDGPSKTQMRSRGALEPDHPAEALYDLARDPQESCNRAGDPGLAPVLADLRARLDAWMRDTGDLPVEELRAGLVDA